MSWPSRTKLLDALASSHGAIANDDPRIVLEFPYLPNTRIIALSQLLRSPSLATSSSLYNLAGQYLGKFGKACMRTVGCEVKRPSFFFDQITAFLKRWTLPRADRLPGRA